MTITTGDLIAASIVVRDIQITEDRELIQKIIRDYANMKNTSEKLLGWVKEMAADLDCLPAREHILLALKKRRSEVTPTKVWYDKGAGTFYLNFDHVPPAYFNQQNRITELIER